MEKKLAEDRKRLKEESIRLKEMSEEFNKNKDKMSKQERKEFRNNFNKDAEKHRLDVAYLKEKEKELKEPKPKRIYKKKTAEEKESHKKKQEEKKQMKDYKIKIPVLPEISPEVDLPKYYAVEKKKNVKTKKKDGSTQTKEVIQYKLVNPLTKQRNIATRDGSKPITLKRKDVDKVTAVDMTPKEIPINAFVKKDRKEAVKFDIKREKYDQQGILPKNRKDRSAFAIKERGRPEHLPKNIAWHKARNQEETKEETHQQEEKEGEPNDYQPDEYEPDMPPEPPGKKRGRPKKYETEEERKKAKHQQTLISNKNKYHQKKKAKKQAEENAMFDDTGYEPPPPDVGVGRGLSKSVIKKAKELQKKTVKTVTGLVTGSTDYSPSVRSLIQKYGDKVITKIVIGRTPVSSAITMALNVVSMGQFSENQAKNDYDKLFHLFVELTLGNIPIRLEKNEVITMTEGHPDKPDTERDENVLIEKPLSLNEMLQNARDRMGEKFFKYDSANNNCQDFIMALLQGSSLGSQENYDFIKQDTKSLFEGIRGTRGIAKQITNLGQRVNILTNGAGLDDYIVASVVFPKDYSIPKARNWLKENGYKCPKVDLEKNTIRFRQESPASIKKKGFTEYKTKELGDGIELILVYKNNISSNTIMPKLVKGSKEAKEFMAKMRAKRKGGSVEGEPIDRAGGGLYAGAGLYAGRGIESDGESESDTEPVEPEVIIHHHHHYHHMEDGKGLGKKVASTLIHRGIPMVTSALGAVAGSTASPAGAFVGKYAGEALGHKIASAVGKKTGLGLRKGSPEAKAWGEKMKKMREMKKKGHM